MGRATGAVGTVGGRGLVLAYDGPRGPFPAGNDELRQL